MNNLPREDLICGFTITPEIYYECVNIPPTIKEKRKQFFSNLKELMIEGLWFLFLLIGIILQVAGLAYLAGMFFKMGMH